MAILFFLLQIVYGVFEAAAIFAGIEYWLDWPGWVCAIIGGVLVFGLRMTLLTVPFGIVGAHYGFGWSWTVSVLLFFGPLLLVLAVALLGSAAGGAKRLLRW